MMNHAPLNMLEPLAIGGPIMNVHGGSTPTCTAFLTLSLLLVLPLAHAEESLIAAQNSKPRTVVLTDIGGDPDDKMSMVRLLLYANEMDIEGLYAGPGNGVNPHLILERIDAYEKVRPNLKLHADGYPEAKVLRATVKADTRKRGMQAIGAGKDTPASRHLIEVVDRDDRRPVWVQIWGAGGALAQALWDVRAERSPKEVARFVSKLRVYDIGGQDETGAWALHEFPELKWLRSENMFYAFAPYRSTSWKEFGTIFSISNWHTGAKQKNPRN